MLIFTGSPFSPIGPGPPTAPARPGCPIAPAGPGGPRSPDGPYTQHISPLNVFKYQITAEGSVTYGETHLQNAWQGS